MNFPYEIFDLIIRGNEKVYRLLLSVPAFARLLTVGRIFDKMVEFEYDVRVKILRE